MHIPTRDRERESISLTVCLGHHPPSVSAGLHRLCGNAAMRSAGTALHPKSGPMERSSMASLLSGDDADLRFYQGKMPID